MTPRDPGTAPHPDDLPALRDRVRASGRAPGEVADPRPYRLALLGVGLLGAVMVALGVMGVDRLAAWVPGPSFSYGMALGGVTLTALALQLRVWVVGDRSMRWSADGYVLVTLLAWLIAQDTVLFQGTDLAASAQAGFEMPAQAGPITVGIPALLSLYVLWHLTLAVMALGGTLRPSADRLRAATFAVLIALAGLLVAGVIEPTWFDADGLTTSYRVMIASMLALYVIAATVWIRGSGHRPTMSRAGVGVGLLLGGFELLLQVLVDFGTSADLEWVLLLVAVSLALPGAVELIALAQALAARTRGEAALLQMVLADLVGLDEPVPSGSLEAVASTALAGAGSRAPFLEPRGEPPSGLDVHKILAEQQYQLAVQPIVNLADGSIAGYEALARFPGHPTPTPDVVIAEAHRLGIGVELELALVAAALARLEQLPPHVYLSVNLGVEALLDPRVLGMLSDGGASRLVVEVTEHLPIEDYTKVRAGIEPMRAMGVRLAIDDAGAGFASLRHVIQLRPDLLKLDRSLIVDADQDPARRAVIAAMVDIAGKGGMDVVGEGVERPEEAQALRILGVSKAQGYLFGRPTVAPFTAVAEEAR